MKGLQYFLRWLTMVGFVIQAAGQSTAISYQGRLNSTGAPVNGRFDICFSLFATNTDGFPLVTPVTNNAVIVSNGLFTCTVDFGAGNFTGADRWLELAVRTNGFGAFTVLAPRQQITAAPLALYAPSAGTAANVPAANITGTLSSTQLPTHFIASSPALLDARATNLTAVDTLGRPTAYLTDPFTTNIVVFTNAYSVNFPTNNLGYNGTYRFWPTGSTTNYAVYTNGARTLLRAVTPDAFIYYPGAYLMPLSQLPITADSLTDFDNLFLSDDPMLPNWADSFTRNSAYPNITALSAVLVTNISTNFAPTILTNVYVANLDASLNAGMIGALGLLTNTVTGDYFPPVLLTNQNLSLGWLCDSFAAKPYYPAGNTTNFTEIVDAFATRAALAAKHAAPQIVAANFLGYPAYYYSTNQGYGYWWTIMLCEAGINDLRYGLTNWGPTPDLSLIHSQSNMIRRAAANGSKLFVLLTVPDWCNAANYTNATGTALWPPFDTYTNNNGYTYNEFLRCCANVRRWQLAQVANTNLPVLVVDLKNLPLAQCTVDGLHPTTAGQRLIGNLIVWTLVNGWCPQVPVTDGVFTNVTIPGGPTFYITNGVIQKVQ